MLIKNLFSLFGGSHQEGRSDNASPNVIEEKESIVIIPEKFKDDIDNSSSRGNESTQVGEEQLDQQIDVIRTLLTNGADNEAVLRALRGAEGLLKQRNQLLIIR